VAPPVFVIILITARRSVFSSGISNVSDTKAQFPNIVVGKVFSF
jgi:hypothetical protein